MWPNQVVTAETIDPEASIPAQLIVPKSVSIESDAIHLLVLGVPCEIETVDAKLRTSGQIINPVSGMGWTSRYARGVVRVFIYQPPGDIVFEFSIPTYDYGFRKLTPPVMEAGRINPDLPLLIRGEQLFMYDPDHALPAGVAVDVTVNLLPDFEA